MKLSKYPSKNRCGAAKFCQNLQFLISGKYIVQCKLLDTNWLIGLGITAVFVRINRNFNKNDENLMCCFVRREHSSSLINYQKKFNKPQAGTNHGTTITHSNKEKLAAENWPARLGYHHLCPVFVELWPKLFMFEVHFGVIFDILLLGWRRSAQTCSEKSRQSWEQAGITCKV